MPNPGEKAPSFTLHDTEKKPRSLLDLLSGRPIVLAFFPGAFTGVCTREMCAFRDGFQDVNAQIVGISVNDPWSNKAFADHNKLNLQLLSDYNREVVRQYNVFHNDFGGLKGYTAAKRSVFVLDRNGVITYKWVSEDPGKEPPYDELKKAVAKTS